MWMKVIKETSWPRFVLRKNLLKYMKHAKLLLRIFVVTVKEKSRVTMFF